MAPYSHHLHLHIHHSMCMETYLGFPGALFSPAGGCSWWGQDTPM